MDREEYDENTGIGIHGGEQEGAMEGKWTAGPWSAVRYTDGDHCIIGPSGDERITTMRHNVSEAEADANARLIAEAPGMVEMLERYVSGDYNGLGGDIEDLDREVRAILARIHGEK